LSLFGIFSPDYKLLGEQCYWFVDVVFKATQRRTGSVLIPGPFHHLAGKYGKVKIRQSDEVKARLLDTFEILAEFRGIADGEGKQEWWTAKSHHVPYISLLLHPSLNESDAGTHQILAVSLELQYRSAGALALITASPLCRSAVVGTSGLLCRILQSLHQDYSTEMHEVAQLAITNILPVIPEIPPLSTYLSSLIPFSVQSLSVTLSSLWYPSFLKSDKKSSRLTFFLILFLSFTLQK
jgi:hypothetical protein